jgi:glutamyl-tRNA(Gln) amidotransferase subunit D
MAKAVLDQIAHDAHGVIITHGTDTLHYTAAALAFILDGLNIPVVLVGSQRSSDRGSSDASANLMGALRFITQARVPGVFIAMHDTPNDGEIAIIDGVRARKNHTSRRDAFTSVNAPLLARVTNGKTELVDIARAEHLRKYASTHPRILPIREDIKVGLWYAHPQSFADELIIYDHYDALLVVGTGMGHLPISKIDEFTAEHERIKERIEKLAKRIPVVMASQAIWGRVNMDVYSPGRTLQELGVLGQGCDTHLECAFVKLAWLASQHPKEARAMYSTSLRGEISARSPLEDSHKSG